MSRYVILSFAFMGIAFYELSGGADFQPGSHTTAEALGIAPRNVDQTQQIAELAPRADTTGTSLPGIVPASLPAVAGRAQPEAVISLASLETPKVAKGIAATTPVQMSATETQEPTADAQDEPAASKADLRMVDASRVNIRSGPGTSYAVLTRLGKGDSVEVLRDTGDGWLKLRVVDTDRIGWMADFLVTASVE